MSKLANQWIELFRAGKYPQGEFTTQDLDQMVANYRPSNPEFEEAPSTIGHPKGAAPAWAWWEGLKRDGDTLLGKMKDVQPRFEEMVQNRLFPKRSIGLVKRPSGWNLQHVAWLGAEAPQVKGLTDCSFASVSGLVQVEFEESAMATENETIVASLKAWFEEKFGTKPAAAGATFTEADVKRIAGEAAKVAADAAVAPVQAKLDAKVAEFAQRDAALATVETKSRTDAAVAKLKASGKWVPAFDKMGLALVFAALAPVTATVEFGEGAEKKTQTPFEMLVFFMEGLKAIVPTDPVYTGAMPTKGAKSSIQFTEDKHRADQNSVDLANLSNDRANEKKISFAEAMKEILHEQPRLAIPGGASAGQA